MEKHLAHPTASELKTEVTQGQTFAVHLVFARSVVKNQEELISLSMDSQTLTPCEESPNVGCRTKLLYHVAFRYDQITTAIKAG